MWLYRFGKFESAKEVKSVEIGKEGEKYQVIDSTVATTELIEYGGCL